MVLLFPDLINLEEFCARRKKQLQMKKVNEGFGPQLPPGTLVSLSPGVSRAPSLYAWVNVVGSDHLGLYCGLKILKKSWSQHSG